MHNVACKVQQNTEHFVERKKKKKKKDLNPLKMIWFCYNIHFPQIPARVYSGLVFNGLKEKLPQALMQIGGMEKLFQKPKSKSLGKFG